LIALNLFIFSIFLPLMATLWLARWPRRPLVPWLSSLWFAAAFVAQAFVVTPWAWLGIEFRWLLLLAFFGALFATLRRADTPPVTPSTIFTVVKLLLGAFFTVGAIMGLRGYAVPPETIALDFPLRDGTYIVGQGGSSVFVNYHNVYKPQQYALDIGKLNAFGTRASGLYPSDLSKYAIFGDALHSPCDGTVLTARDAVPDLSPPARTAKLPEGNFVKLDCGGTSVYLAHMRRGSVRVRPGAAVRRGDLLGIAGNSGNTTEPHLHIHAERNGVGVGILFGGRWLVRNSVITVRSSR
jgi:hypothetical protein